MRPKLRGALLAGCAGIVLLLAASAAGSSTAFNAGIVWAADPGIVSANVDGSGRHLIAPRLGDGQGTPAWSRDGSALAWSLRNSDHVRIHVLWPATGAERDLESDWRSPRAPTRRFAYVLDPSWSPDGEHLVLSDSWTLVNGTIRVVSVPSGRWTSLTRPNSRRSDEDPAWSPDGRTIAFVRYRGGEGVGEPVLYLMRPDGSGLRRLTRGRAPSWSPDGRNLVFAWGDGIYRIRADGRGRTRVARRVNPQRVEWSPDGRKFLFTSGSNLWTMNRDGTNRERIARIVNLEGAAWRPG